MILRATVIGAACAAAFAAAPAAAQQQQQQQQPQEQKSSQAQKQKQDLRSWNMSQLYRNTWSADEMIGTNVRGQNGEEIGEVKDIIVERNGSISKVVVEVGGFFEIGDQHIGVPWKEVQIGRDMQWVQVPLREVESGTYSLFGRVPQGEDVAAARSSWRVNELIGDYASLADVPRYAMVTDALFDKQGKLRAVIVNRPAGPWGAAGWYGYPYYGYNQGYAYDLPYRSNEVADYGRFDYVLLVEQSDMAGNGAGQRKKQEQARRQGQRQGAAAGAGQQAGQQK